MNLMSLINPSLEHAYWSNYCSNLVSNHSLIRITGFVLQFTSKLCNLFFISFRFKILFCRDRFEILNFATKQVTDRCSVWRWELCPAYGLLVEHACCKFCQYSSHHALVFLCRILLQESALTWTTTYCCYTTAPAYKILRASWRSTHQTA